MNNEEVLKYPVEKFAPNWLGIKATHDEIKKDVDDYIQKGKGMIIRNYYITRLIHRYINYLEINTSEEEIELLKKIDNYLGVHPLDNHKNDVIDVIYFLSNVSLNDLISTKLSIDEIKDAEVFVNSIKYDIEKVQQILIDLSKKDNLTNKELYIKDQLVDYIEEYHNSMWNYNRNKQLEKEYNKSKETLFKSAHTYKGPVQ